MPEFWPDFGEMEKLVWVGQRIFVVREAGHPEISHVSDFGSVWFKYAQLRM